MELLEDAQRFALFLDFDGTLVDIAPAPDAVVVPGELAPMLGRIADRLGGALAVLTGRPIADIDRFLAPLKPVAAGVHGSEVRLARDGPVELQSEPIEASIIRRVRKIAQGVQGALLELKAASVAIHYRNVPEAEGAIEAALSDLVADSGDHLILCRGRKVLEIVPAHVSKGDALETFMRRPAFRGRRPIMIGDDVSDLSAFAAARRFGGRGLKVAGEQFHPGDVEFSGPEHVRRWLDENWGRGE